MAGEGNNREGEMRITVRKMSSGAYHIKGEGPCNWSTVPEWPCSRETIRQCGDLAACREFLDDAARAAEEARRAK